MHVAAPSEPSDLAEGANLDSGTRTSRPRKDTSSRPLLSPDRLSGHGTTGPARAPAATPAFKKSRLELWCLVPRWGGCYHESGARHRSIDPSDDTRIYNAGQRSLLVL